MNLTEALNQAKQVLEQNGIDQREARLLLAHTLKVNKEKLPLIKEISLEEKDVFFDLVSKRCQGMPFAYIVGQKEFMKLKFLVNENVLIPREDTEVLVQEALDFIEKSTKPNLTLLDLCTGSGCIAISIYKNTNKNIEVMASDKSKEALKMAEENAKFNDANISFIESDLFENIKQSFDIIVSNPPYIKTNIIDTLQKEVKDYEPKMALDGGEDGLSFYRIIIKEAKKHLNKDGILMFEIGYDQAEAVSKFFEENNYKNIKIIKDYGTNDRVVMANYI